MISWTTFLYKCQAIENFAHFYKYFLRIFDIFFMQVGHKMAELEAFGVLSVILEHPVYIQCVFFH